MYFNDVFLGNCLTQCLFVDENDNDDNDDATESIHRPGAYAIEGPPLDLRDADEDWGLRAYSLSSSKSRVGRAL